MKRLLILLLSAAHPRGQDEASRGHRGSALAREIERVLKEPDIRERFTTLGVAPTGGSPEAFGGRIGI